MKKICSILLLAAVATETVVLADDAHKISVGLPFLSYNRKTISRNVSGTSPMGLAAEYSGYLSNNLALSLQFTMNLGSGGFLFLGGGGGLLWYFIGGANIVHIDPYIRSINQATFQVYSLIGLGGRAFDFSSIDKATDGAIDVRDAKDKTKGSYLGPLIALGAEFPTAYFATLGTRLQIINSIASDTSPDISGTEFWIYTNFTL